MCSQLRPPSSRSSFTSKDLTRADDVLVMLPPQDGWRPVRESNPPRVH